jgi:hypothetical protein
VPLDLREAALAAAKAKIVAVTDFATVERNPTWTVEKPIQPAAAIYDGGEVADQQDTAPPTALVRMNLAVEVLATQPTVALALTELNRLKALVQLALCADPSLGGTASDVVYAGCDEPQTIDLTESPCEASLQVNFTIERLEGRYTPYAYPA